MITTKKSLFIIITITILFGILFRLSLAYYTFNSPFHIYNGHFISILSPDPALYGYYATLLLKDLPHLTDVNMIEYIIYFLVKFTPLSLDFVMYFGPAFFASLIAIPVILILSLYSNNKLLLFFAGLTSTIGYGYYSRTYLGYFDTDVLNIFFPFMILYGMIITIKKQNYYYTILPIVFNIGYLFWYHSSEVLTYALNGFFILFCLIFYLKQSELYKVGILLGISIIKIAFLYKIILLAIFFPIFHFIRINYKYFLGLYIAALVFVLYKIDISQFYINMHRYIFKPVDIQNLNYKFLAPMQLVAEAQKADFHDFIKLISGNIVIFSLSILGYILFAFRHKEILLALPILFLGFLSIEAGVRFHIYGVPILILGYFFLFYIFIKKFQKTIFLYGILLISIILPTYENYKSIEFWNTKIAYPVFLPEQIKALNILKQHAKKEDYIVTWWDYGWPLWYYTGMKTMIDNGRHHEDNFTVSQILMSQDQTFAYNAINYFYDLYSKNHTPAIIQALEKQKDPKKLFHLFEQKDMKHERNVDKYLVLPIQMTKLIYTIFTFANIDPDTGKKLPKKLFFEFNRLKEDSKFIYLTNHTKIDKEKGVLIQGKSIVPIKHFYHIIYRNNQKLLQDVPAYPQGLHVIDYEGKFYAMDDYFFNTLFIQLMFFNNYDPRYFEPVYTGTTIAIFKIK